MERPAVVEPLPWLWAEPCGGDGGRQGGQRPQRAVAVLVPHCHVLLVRVAGEVAIGDSNAPPPARP